MLKLNNNFQYIPNKNLIIIWQARAACTIVNKMYFEEIGLLQLINEYSSKYNKNPNYLPVHFYNYKVHLKRNIHKNIKKRLPVKNLKYIQFIVNPYRRAVSSYIFCMTYSQKIYGNLSFNDFINYLLSIQKKDNIHYDKQLFYLNKEICIDYIKMEQIKEKIPYINKKYDLNFSLKISHHNTKTKELDNKFIGNTEWNSIKDNIPSKYYNFYNKILKKKIEKLYNDDIKLLIIHGKNF